MKPVSKEGSISVHGEGEPISPPPQIPDHELLRRIGRGSYGEVWLARSVMGEYRAVKIVHRAAFGGDSRPFEREFEGIRKFEPISRSHESQLPILHVGLNEAAGCFYYVMELADCAEGEREKGGKGAEEKPGGVASHSPPFPFSPLPPFDADGYTPRTLRAELERHGRLPLAQCLDIGLALTTALAHLHRHGLVHRDIKPSNIIFVQGRPKLADIGLVTDAGDARSIVGTEGYLAPEGPGSPQADIYSLGKVLYEISTGRDRRHFPDLPLDLAPGSARVLPLLGERAGVRADDPSNSLSGAESGRRPDEDNPHSEFRTPHSEGLLELNEILLKACARDAPERYPSAEAMHADLVLLQRGQSIKRQRAVERRWAVARKVVASLAGASVLAAGAWALSTKLAWRNPDTTRAKADVKRPPSPEVIRLCKLGGEAETKGTKESLTEAFELLNRAIALDPGYVPAYLGLASAYNAAPDWLLPARQALPEVKRAATSALQIDPSSVGALQWLGVFKMEFEWDWASAEADFKRAIQLAPKHASLHFFYAILLLNTGRLPEARVEQERMLALAPNDPQSINGMIRLFCTERRFDDALALALKGRREHTNSFGPRIWLAWIYEQKGMFAQAIDEIRAARAIDDGPDFMALLGHVYAASGDKERAREVLKQLQELSIQRHVPQCFIARIHVALGDSEAAIVCLQKAVLEKSLSLLGGPGLLGIALEPHLDPLRSDPRFQQLLRDMHLH